MSCYVCTLYEGSYHLGLAALVNSLYKCGFRGIIYVGVRGDLPPWSQPLQDTENGKEFVISEDCKIVFIPIDTGIHLTNYKPTFMLDIINKYLNDNDAVCYLDPDITIKCRWSFIEEWVDLGIGLVEDCTYPRLPSNHPLRLGWLNMAKSLGLSEQRHFNRYYNAGFIGIAARYKEALVVWKRLIQGAEPYGFNQTILATKDRTTLWQAADQDILNLMLMTTNFPLSTVGPDGMDFVPGGYIMSHAVNSPKPWAKNFVQSALRGLPPTLAEKGYWANVQTPIRLFAHSQVRRKKLEINIGLAIGRIMRRS